MHPSLVSFIKSQVALAKGQNIEFVTAQPDDLIQITKSFTSPPIGAFKIKAREIIEPENYIINDTTNDNKPFYTKIPKSSFKKKRKS